MKKISVIIFVIFVSGLLCSFSSKNIIYGIVGLVISILLEIYKWVSQNRKDQEIENLIDAQNSLNKDKGNIYTKIFNDKIKKQIKIKGHAKYDLKLLEKAIRSNPEHIDTLKIYLAIKLLKIESDSFNSRNIDKINLENIDRIVNKYYDKLLKNKAFNILGIYWDIKGDYKKAQNLFIKSSKINQFGWREHLATSLQRDHRFQESVDLIKKGTNPKNLYYFHYLALARGHDMMENNEKEALINYQIAYKLRGNKVEILKGLSCIYLKMGMFYKFNYYQLKYCLILLILNQGISLKLLSGALTISFFNILQILSRIIWLITSHIRLVRNIHQFIFSPVHNYEIMGEDYLKSSYYKGAIVYFEKCNRICRKNVKYLERLAISYALTNDREEAINLMNAAISLQPKNDILKFNLESIKNCKELKIHNISNKKEFRKFTSNLPNSN